MAENKREDYVFSATDSQVYSLVSRTSFSGAFGLISESGGKIQSMYLGKGRLLQRKLLFGGGAKCLCNNLPGRRKLVLFCYRTGED